MLCKCKKAKLVLYNQIMFIYKKIKVKLLITVSCLLNPVLVALIAVDLLYHKLKGSLGAGSHHLLPPGRPYLTKMACK